LLAASGYVSGGHLFLDQGIPVAGEELRGVEDVEP
jgi:hypothetical protein